MNVPKRRFLLLFLASALTLGVVWARREAHGLRNALSLSYWSERIRGVHTYDPSLNYLKHGDFGRREIALTFDDGPHPESANKILDILKAKGIKATFFLVGKRIEQHPEVVRRMLAEGHVVGNHTQDHLRLTTLDPAQIQAEIRDCEAAFRKAAPNCRMTFFRPPGMRFNRDVLNVVRQDGYTMVGWSEAAKDFISKTQPRPDPKLIEAHIADQIENGSIVLLHDIPATADVLGHVIDHIQSKGYRFVTVPQMLDRLKSRNRAKTR